MTGEKAAASAAFRAEREGNFDLLRIVCTLSVILIHVSTVYKTAINTDPQYRQQIAGNIATIAACDTFTRFAVPCFWMLSGAFLLSNPANRAYKAFYRKTFTRIGIPMLIFSAYYVMVREIEPMRQLLSGQGGFSELVPVLREAARGIPMYHMWYLFTTVGVYVLIPALIRLKDDMGETTFCRACWCFLPIAVLSGWTDTYYLEWSIGKTACALGYVLIGYTLRHLSFGKGHAGKGFFCFLLGIAGELVLFTIQYRHSCAGIPASAEVHPILQEFNPLVAVSSILIFLGFSNLPLHTQALRGLSGRTFLIYLIHAQLLERLTSLLPPPQEQRLDCRISMLLYTLLIFLASDAFAVFYQWGYGKLDKNHRFTELLARLVRLK